MPDSVTLIWDDTCSFCARSRAVLQRLDGFRAVRWVGSHGDRELVDHLGITRTQTDSALQAIAVQGRQSSGFDAIRLVLSVSPVTYLVAPFLGVPPAPTVGRRWYRHLAARRRCTVDQGIIAVDANH
jgi:predicted DCC family thiol-disulfide oxidoreductase YuxK